MLTLSAGAPGDAFHSTGLGSKAWTYIEAMRSGLRSRLAGDFPSLTYDPLADPVHAVELPQPLDPSKLLSFLTAYIEADKGTHTPISDVTWDDVAQTLSWSDSAPASRTILTMPSPSAPPASSPPAGAAPPDSSLPPLFPSTPSASSSPQPDLPPRLFEGFGFILVFLFVYALIS